MDRGIKQSTDSSISQNTFSYLKMCSMRRKKKTSQLKITKKRVNIANLYIYIYTQIYIPILYVTRMTQNINVSGSANGK